MMNMRRRYGTLYWLGVAGIVASCGGSTDGASANPGTTTYSTEAVVTTLAATTTSSTPPVDVDKVDKCVTYVQFAAFTADAAMGKIWDDAGQNVAQLTQDCVELGRSDPAELTRIADAQTQLDAFFAANGTSTTSTSLPRATTTTVPAPTPTPTPTAAESTPVPDTAPSATVGLVP